jgi:hypothetical protein
MPSKKVEGNNESQKPIKCTFCTRYGRTADNGRSQVQAKKASPLNKEVKPPVDPPKPADKQGNGEIRGFVVNHPLIQDPTRLVPQIPIHTLNQNHKALIDTGSTISVVAANLLLKGTEFHPWPESLGPILMLDGGVSVPKGLIDLDFQVARRKYTQYSLVVLSSLEGFLLGMDFLHTCGLIIDMSKLEWGFSKTWPNEVYQLNCSESKDLSSRHLQLMHEFQVDEIKDLLKHFPDVIDAPLGREKAVKGGLYWARC